MKGEASLELSRVVQGQLCLVKVDGSLLIASAQQFFEFMKQVWRENHGLEINVDLKNVAEIDTAGFQVLLLFKKEAARSKRIFRLIEHSPSALQILDVFGAVGIFGDKIHIHDKEKPKFRFQYGMKKYNDYFR